MNDGILSTCDKCKKQFKPQGNWQKICIDCWKSSNRKSPTNKDVDIHRQVFLKVASDQLKGVEAKELIDYAKEIEKEFNAWN